MLKVRNIHSKADINPVNKSLSTEVRKKKHISRTRYSKLIKKLFWLKNSS